LALLVMHQALREMPGPRTEMAALVAHSEPVAESLRLYSCGHVAPLLVRTSGEHERLDCGVSAGLGGRSTPTPGIRRRKRRSGDRLVLISDGVVHDGPGQAGLGEGGLVRAALGGDPDSASATVRAVHAAVLEATGGNLGDDATVVCLQAG
jgi:serine phosphatase RsbU (regulator of sigma subunit)